MPPSVAASAPDMGAGGAAKQVVNSLLAHFLPHSPAAASRPRRPSPTGDGPFDPSCSSGPGRSEQKASNRRLQGNILLSISRPQRQQATHLALALMLRPPPLPPLPPAPRASLLPPPKVANPNTDPTTTNPAAGTGMGVAAWWRRALGQRFNPAGVAAVAAVAVSEPRLALPHVSVQDIRWLDWGELRRAGFCGVVFDKDNTLTAPYAPALWPPLAAAFDQCLAAFPAGALAVYSNSAGLKEYDPDGVEARAIEATIKGVHVIRHDTKKPAGTAKEIESYFGCSASNLVLVGDRYFTDVVYGNRNGFLTVLTEPLSFANESYIVRRVRKLEAYIISYWYKKGHKPIEHPLLPDVRRIVKFDPYEDPITSRV